MIGSSNNPVSGLTLCTLVIAALLMVAMGVSGIGGVTAVLGIAAVICVSSAVAGEMLQDLKVDFTFGDRLLGIVRALAMHVRAQVEQDFRRRQRLEDHDVIHRFERRH